MFSFLSMCKKTYQPFYADYLPHISKLEKREIRVLAARLFSTEDGKKFLSYLEHVTLRRVLSGSASEDQLRHSEGQRSLLMMILNLIQQAKY